MEKIGGYRPGSLSTSGGGVWVGGWSRDLVDKWGYRG